MPRQFPAGLIARIRTPVTIPAVPGSVWGMIKLLVPCFLDTRYTVEDIEGALLKQLKAAKEAAILVKKPEEDNIRFSNYGKPLRSENHNGFFFRKHFARPLTLCCYGLKVEVESPLDESVVFCCTLSVGLTKTQNVSPRSLDPSRLHHDHRHHVHSDHAHDRRPHRCHDDPPPRRHSSPLPRPQDHDRRPGDDAPRRHQSPSPCSHHHHRHRHWPRADQARTPPQKGPPPLRLAPLPPRGHLRGGRGRLHLHLPRGPRGRGLRERCALKPVRLSVKKNSSWALGGSLSCSG